MIDKHQGHTSLDQFSVAFISECATNMLLVHLKAMQNDFLCFVVSAAHVSAVSQKGPASSNGGDHRP